MPILLSHSCNFREKYPPCEQLFWLFEPLGRGGVVGHRQSTMKKVCFAAGIVASAEGCLRTLLCRPGERLSLVVFGSWSISLIFLEAGPEINEHTGLLPVLWCRRFA